MALKVVILCGGLGSRLAEETKDNSKTSCENRKISNIISHNEHLF